MVRPLLLVEVVKLLTEIVKGTKLNADLWNH